MSNIFDSIPAGGAVATADAPRQPQNIFDIIPATSNVFDGIPITSGNAQLKQAQFLANILHPPIINPALGVHQPGTFSSGFSIQPPSLQNADDWGFTAATAPKILNNAVTRTIGTVLNASGEAIKGGVESDLFKLTGQPDLAAQETIATIAKMYPQLGLQASAHGVDISNPYEDARQTLPTAERIASGIGPGLLQSAPQMALTAIQPELGAASFGFTPQGFDPVQAAAMMIAPAGGKMIGGMTENLAAKAGITSKQALGLINRLGGGTGVASLISAPTAYQIAQMQPGPERDDAIQNAVSSAIIASVLGGMGEHSAPEEPAATAADTARNAVSRPNAEENLPVQGGPAKQQPQKPISQKIDELHAAIEDIKASLIANQALSKLSEPAPVGATDETSADTASQSADATVSPAPIASEVLQGESSGAKFQPSGDNENTLTPGQIQQSIQEAVNEKHAKINVADASKPEWAADVVRRQAESAFSEVRQGRAILANTIHDPDFYGTEIGQRLQTIAGQNGLRVVFYKGDENSPKGFFDPQDGNLYLRTNVPQSEMAAILEHEAFHQRAAAGDVAAQRVIAGVDLNSLGAQKIAAKYNSWLAMHGKPPLSPEKLKEEIGAFHVSGQSYEGIAPSDAFKDPAEALTAAREYHGATPTEQGPSSIGNPQFTPGDLEGNRRPTPFDEALSTGKMRIRSPRGDFIYIPQERLQSALSAGYKLAPTPKTNPISARQPVEKPVPGAFDEDRARAALARSFALPGNARPKPEQVITNSPPGQARSGTIDRATIDQFETLPYGQFRNFPGDRLAGHELLQNAWLRVNGHGGRVFPQNPAMALPQEFHAGAVTPMQYEFGLHHAVNLAKMTAEENILFNAEILRRLNVPHAAIEQAVKASLQYAKTLSKPGQ